MRYFILLVGLVVQLGAFLLFCKGFFPTKVLLTPNQVEQFSTPFPDGFTNAAAQFDKVVIMVVDAMRSDFMFSDQSNMGFVHQLLNQHYGIGFTAFSNPPTVTLPRLKGITTGSTPNFIDAVLNIAEDDTSSTLGDQDSWIKQMFLEDWKINMFGDDTWLKLFPEYFSKTEGTASFYVSDFTIVDNNVTRHLDYELSDEGQSNWDCMILHYLGLDHIGHKGGPQSSNMPVKQKEMDAIIERIFNEVTMKNPNSLFIVLGDHGMNDVGNHGGSSTPETSAALLLISQKLKNIRLNEDDVKAPIEWNDDYNYFTKIDQIDLVPTLSELLGLDIPINNLGTFIPQFLKLYKTEEEKKNILLKNALQLKVLIDKSNGFISELNNMEIPELLEYIKEAKDELSRTSSDYNYFDIFTGLGLYAVITIASFITYGIYFKKQFFTAFFDVVFFVVYSVNFIASSMVEEEHHLWWFFTTIFIAYSILKALRSKKIAWFGIIILAIGLRLLKAWNNSGQKHNLKANMKISTYLSQMSDEIGPNVYACILVLTFLPMIISVNAYTEDGSYFKILQVLIAMLSFLIGTSKMLSFLSESYDLNNENMNFPSWCYSFIEQLETKLLMTDYNKINNVLFNLLQRVWLFTLVFALLNPVFKKLILKKPNNNFQNYLLNILSVVSFILISQTNYLNVPIFPLLYMILFGFKSILPNSSFNSNTFNLFTLLMQNLTFFQFGSTNSLSSVDLTNSFNGLSNYNMFLSGLLTYTCNWAGPIFWTVAHLYLVFSKTPEVDVQTRKWKILFDRLIFNFVFYSTSGLLLLGCCYHLRFHLFIWTVFSPKILYFLSWLVCNIVFDYVTSVIIVAFYV